MFLNEKKNDKISIKIGDLGSSTDKTRLKSLNVGTLGYQSPEISLYRRAYTAKNDVWY